MIRYVGADIEPAAMPLWVLFIVQDTVKEEIERRSWLYLKSIGYNPFKKGSIETSLVKRNNLDIVKIAADFEQNFQHLVINIDVPRTQFDLLVPEEKPVA